MAVIKVFSLSTCGNCQSVKDLLEKRGLSFDTIEVDLLDTEARLEIVQELKKVNPMGTFPTTLIDETVILGYRPREILSSLPKPPRTGFWTKARRLFRS